MPVTFDQFCADCEASGLLTADEVAAARAGLGESTDPQQLARALVKQEKLTAFQAQQVYAGKGKALVLGNYVLLDKLGQGGMGAVYKASHRRMKRIVALKVLSPDLTKTEEAVSRFLREVEAAGRLQHPHIVNAFDADCVGKTHFLVMEYVEGSDLSSLVKGKGPLAVDKAVHCVLQAAKGLEYAHSQGIVHRDIKPANLLLDKAGVVKILDMGLARFSDAKGAAELTQSGAVMGTVDYMPPEQALSSKNADHRSDIYSLGITLWYLLTGRAAYDGDSLMAKLLAHSQQPVPSLKAACAAVPASLDAVFQKMVAKKPEERFPSMSETITALEQALFPGAAAPSLMSVRSEASRLDEAFGELDRAVTEQRVVATGTIVQPPKERGTAPKPPPATARKSSLEKMARPIPLRLAHAFSTLLPTLRYAAIGLVCLTIVALLWWGTRPKQPTSVSQAKPGKPSPELSKKDASSEVRPVSLQWPFDESTAKVGQAAWAKHLDQDVVEKNSLGMEMVLIPPGSFKMGSPPTEAGREKNEDQVSVTLTKPFRMARTEVTVAQYRAFADDAKYVTSVEQAGEGSGFSDKDTIVALRPGASFRNPAFPQADDHPALFLDWSDAARFCEWLGKREGREYRLPTEAEWEWTCRAGTATRFSCGDDEQELVRWGNGSDASLRKHFARWGTLQGDDGYTFTAPVGRFLPNPFGVCDLVGNVSEWCADGYLEHLPGGMDPFVEHADNRQRIYRGGYWFIQAFFDRSAHRWTTTADNRTDYIGFRPVEVLSASPSNKTASTIRPEPPPATTPPSSLQSPFDEPTAKSGQAAWAKYLGQPVVQKNSLGMDMVLIPPGTFSMGSSDAERGGREHERPVSTSLSRPFRIARTEVTIGQFRAFVTATSYKTEPERDGTGGYGVVAATGGMPRDAKFNWWNQGIALSESHAVVNITWNDAQAFCDWLSETLNRRYRLPTEAEWEWACRAGSSSRFHFGEDAEKSTLYGNVADRTLNDIFPDIVSVKSSDGVAYLAPTGLYRANPFGLHDMHGNAWEWCVDVIGDRLPGGNDPLIQSSDRIERVIRGGGWDDPLSDVRSGFRGFVPPIARYGDLGFRPVEVLSASTAPKNFSVTPPQPPLAHTAPAPLQWPFVGATAQSSQVAWAKLLSQPVVQKNSLGMDLVLIPPGSFTMGSPASEPERDASETQTPATIAQPFRFGRTEVTVGQFRAFVNDTGYKTGAEREEGEGKGAFGIDADGRFTSKKERNWSNTEFNQSDDHPVVDVNWHDAAAFCEWLSKKESQPYRLPLDVEWEWACRAGTATPWYHGDDPALLDKVGNLRDASFNERFPATTGFSGQDSFHHTSPVGRFPANPFGLVDMHGNVGEWTLTPADIDLLLAKTPLSTQPALYQSRMLRGGSWKEQPGTCRSARRIPLFTHWAVSYAGFRVVLGFSGARVGASPPPVP